MCKCACRKCFDFVCDRRPVPVFVAGQAKPSVSGRGNDSFVTPQKSRKSKKPMITFSSDEEDEEGEQPLSYLTLLARILLPFILNPHFFQLIRLFGI